ncbi:LRR domain containing protein [Parasponia andersonii]|uniref:LRR domain containing protein n=1 Tax=Parasponia andersonii TaxID=3476 RepID=A0A2P5B131_PARAD|nr:LRR domain containing protein [Parasponia andersonii]
MTNKPLLSWIFLISICWILLGVEIDVVSGQCLSDQQTLLIQLKSNLNFNANKSKKLVTWSQNTNCRAWEGVTFDRDGRVTGLSLSEESISGGIDNSSLFSLLYLRSLDLSYNHFGTPIPSKFGYLTSLNYLNLSNAGFVGQIPIAISRLTSLVTLDISFSWTGLVDASLLKLENPGLRMLVQNLSKLETLYLDGVNISAHGSEWCQDLSSSLPSLRELSLSNCYLSGPLDQSLENLKSLSVIHLDGNTLSATVPGFFANFSNLTSLALFYCGLHGNFPKEIFQEPYALSGSLLVLDLHSNQLQGKIPVLPPVCSYIDFSSNNFTSPIPADIGNNLIFTIFFSVSNNYLTGVIPESICNATYLQVLDWSNNSLSGKIPECVPAMSQTLGVLNIRRNNFTGLIPDAFPVDCALETLDLNGNSIEGQIPNSLSHCTRLEVLDLGNNMVTGNFPCLLKNISTLRVLVLRANNFHGRIGCCDTTGTWEKLQIIDLAHNKFSGNLNLLGNCLKRWKAMKVDNADKLKHLSFEFLKFSPSRYYPDAVTVTFKGLEMKLQKILTIFTSIDLSCNHFVGPIPEEVGLLRALYVLNLSSNALTGEIPLSIGKLSQLESLDLSRNKLNGSIPESLAGLTFLSFLNISYNHLVGPIPCGSQIQTFSPDSFAGNNALCGFPLGVICAGEVSMPNTTKGNDSDSDSDTRNGIDIDWNLIPSEIGFIVGFGVVVLPLVFCKRWRISYFHRVDDVAFWIFPLAVTRKWLLSWTTTR